MKTNQGFGATAIIGIIAALIIVGGGAYMLGTQTQDTEPVPAPPEQLQQPEAPKTEAMPPVKDATPVVPEPVDSGADEVIACTADAKICPDGSSVGRTGPNCEFAACPAVNGPIQSVSVITGSVDVVDGDVIQRDSQVVITDTTGDQRILVVDGSGSRLRADGFEVSPNKKYVHYFWGVGDGGTGYIHDYENNRTVEFQMGSVKPSGWLPDGRFEYHLGCVLAGACTRFISVSADNPLEFQEAALE